MLDDSSPCPCGSGQSVGDCCLAVIRNRSASTAEMLMRSRYTAYVVGDTDYLLETWASEHRPRSLQLDEKQRWLGLKIRRAEQGGGADQVGTVEFVARYKIDGKAHRLHETSQFRRDPSSGHWLYVAGDHS